jgi:hypothetical protein
VVEQFCRNAPNLLKLKFSATQTLQNGGTLKVDWARGILSDCKSLQVLNAQFVSSADRFVRPYVEAPQCFKDLGEMCQLEEFVLSFKSGKNTWQTPVNSLLSIAKSILSMEAKCIDEQKKMLTQDRKRKRRRV